LKSCSFRSYFRGGGVRERERERERERGQRKSGEQASGGRKKKKRGRRSSGGCKRKQKADVIVVSELRPILRFETLFLRDEAPALTGPAPAQWRTEQNPCAKQLESGGRIVVATSRRCCSTTTKTATTARDAAFRIAPGAPSFATCEPPRDARNHLLRTCRVFCAMRMSKSARLDSATAVSISSLERPRKSAALVGLAASGATAEARRGAAEAKAAALLGEGARAAARMVLQERGEGRGRKCDEKRETRGREGVALTQDKKKKKTFLPVESPFFAPDTPSLDEDTTRKMSASPSEPCSHAEAWAAARGGPAQAYLPVQRCLVEEWREARARSAANASSNSVDEVRRRKIDGRRHQNVGRACPF
jgi:hypothetical protein